MKKFFEIVCNNTLCLCCSINFNNLKEVTGKNVLLLPMGSGDDGAHSQNEKIELRNYIEGVSINFYHLINLNALYIKKKKWKFIIVYY